MGQLKDALTPGKLTERKVTIRRLSNKNSIRKLQLLCRQFPRFFEISHTSRDQKVRVYRLLLLARWHR